MGFVTESRLRAIVTCQWINWEMFCPQPSMRSLGSQSLPFINFHLASVVVSQAWLSLTWFRWGSVSLTGSKTGTSGQKKQKVGENNAQYANPGRRLRTGGMVEACLVLVHAGHPDLRSYNQEGLSHVVD